MVAHRRIIPILLSILIFASNGALGGNEIITPSNPIFYLYLGVSLALVVTAGAMSGLTLGLLGLDPLKLEILVNSGNATEAKYAKAILPLAKRHHVLLVTLLLVNAASNELLPIFLDRIAGPVIAVVISVTVVLVFGEIIPQAICSRHGLAIGARLSWVVWVLIVITYPISWPLAKLLDFLLGTEHTTFYRKAQLKELVNVHGDEERGGPLDMREVRIVNGALSMADKVCKSVMTPINDLFMLSLSDRLDRDTMDRVIEAGFSRIPIYAGVRTNIVGLVLVKTLIRLDPDDCTPVSSLRLRAMPRVPQEMSLFDILAKFKRGIHMSIVTASESKEVSEKTPLINSTVVLGVLTLEDVIEELIQDEIEDETDVGKTNVMRRVGKLVHRLSKLDIGFDIQ